jgi:hypothetical protein
MSKHHRHRRIPRQAGASLKLNIQPQVLLHPPKTLLSVFRCEIFKQHSITLQYTKDIYLITAIPQLHTLYGNISLFASTCDTHLCPGLHFLCYCPQPAYSVHSAYSLPCSTLTPDISCFTPSMLTLPMLPSVSPDNFHPDNSFFNSSTTSSRSSISRAIAS